MAKDDDIIIRDNGYTYETQESTMTAKQYAEQAKLEADRAEENANLAESAISVTADYKDLAKDWAQKTDGKVVEDGVEVDYSSKYYAAKSKEDGEEQVERAKEEADRAEEIVSHIIPNTYPLGAIFTDGFVELLDGQGWCQGDVLPSGAYTGLVAEFDKYTADNTKGIAWIDFATYEASLLANNNNCILFGYDVVNNLIRLPTIQDGVGIFQAKTIAENNKFYNDQLQNITGTIGAGNGQAFQGRNPVNNYTNNGALSLENASNKIGSTSAGTIDNCFDISFDASLVARAGDETRNKQIRRRLKVQIANVGVLASESQYANFVGGLTNKADKDLGNVSAEGKAEAVGWGMPDYTSAVAVTSSTYTATYKGWLIGTTSTSGNTNTYAAINGLSIGYEYNDYVDIFAPMDIGDVFTTDANNINLKFLAMKGNQ